MAMDLSNQTYQPVNLGSGMTEAFKAGTGVYSDLASNVRALLQTGMGEEGAMRRTQVSEAGARDRAQMAAGIGPYKPKTLSAEEAKKLLGEMGTEDAIKVKTEWGEISRKGTKTDPRDVVLKATMQAVKIAYPKYEELDEESQRRLFTAWWNNIAPQYGVQTIAMPAQPEQVKTPGFWEKTGSFLKGAGNMMGNVLGPTAAFAAGAGGVNPTNIGMGMGTGTAGRTSTYQRALDRLNQQRGQ